MTVDDVSDIITRILLIIGFTIIVFAIVDDARLNIEKDTDLFMEHNNIGVQYYDRNYW